MAASILLAVSGGLQSLRDGRERKEQCERGVVQGHGSVASVPLRGAFILGVNDEYDAAHFRGGLETPPSRRQ